MMIDSIYSKFLISKGISTDTRDNLEDKMFFALKGANFDANLFALDALEKGALFAVVDDKSLAGKDDRLILVDNVLLTLQELAAYHRKKINIPVIAITGTNGKTTTKELIASVLSTKYNVLYTEGNLNNHIGVPLTLLRLNKEHQLAIIEMGASKKGDIKELVDIARPNYGIITNIGIAHLEGFGNFDGVVATKGELYDYIRENNAILFVNKSDELLCKLANGIEQATYSLDKDSNIQGGIIRKDSPLLSFYYTEKNKNERIEVDTNLLGAYNINNLLAAVLIGRFFSVENEDIKEALSNYKPNNSRSQLIVKENLQIIADTYNANPSSMKAALTNFLSIKSELDKLMILGDMNELGEDSETEHLAIYDYYQKELKKNNIDLILCGKIWHKLLADKEQSFENVDSLISHLDKNPLSGKLVLVKGSNGVGLSKLINLYK